MAHKLANLYLKVNQDSNLVVAIHFKAEAWDSIVVPASDGANLQVFNKHGEIQAYTITVNAYLNIGIF